MNLRKDQWLTLAIIAVVVATFVLVFHLPQRHQLAGLQEQLQSAQLARDADRGQLLELTQLRGQVAQIGSQINFYNRRLPEQDDVGSFLKEVSGYAQMCGLEEANFRPGAARPAERAFQKPVEMRFKGHFAELFRFLRQARSMPRLTHVPALSIHSDPNLSGACTIDLTMNIYFTRG